MSPYLIVTTNKSTFDRIEYDADGNAYILSISNGKEFDNTPSISNGQMSDGYKYLVTDYYQQLCWIKSWQNWYLYR